MKNEQIATHDLSAGDRETSVLPVVAEQLTVGKQLRETATVEIRKLVHETPTPVEVDLESEAVTVERVPIDKIVDTLPQVRTEGDTTIIPVLEETLIVTKQIRLVEEIRVSKRKSTVRHQETVNLRSEEVRVERRFP